MAAENIDKLNDQLVAERELRDRFKQDPVAVAREFEVELDADQEAKLRLVAETAREVWGKPVPLVHWNA